MPIYTPAGKAREYSPRALNLFEGCDHDCLYCYVKSMRFLRNHSSQVSPKTNIIGKLERHLTRHVETEQVLLSFIGDPYCAADEKDGLTRGALFQLARHKVPTAVLTKGGRRCLRDQDLFSGFRNHGVPCKVGATLTFTSARDSAKWEPGAATPRDRYETLQKLHDAGIRTWISLEPVIDPDQTLQIIANTCGWVDEIKVGKWNHDPRAGKIDWRSFGERAIRLLEKGKADYYIKKDLQPFVSHLEIAPIHFDQDALCLKSAA